MSNKFFYCLKIEFKGSRFLGWQKQKDFSPTVQGVLESACSKLFKTKEIKTIGSGRTDSGVHSLGHVVKLEAPFKIENLALLKGLNSLLPEDIRILSVEESDKEFLPTNHAIKKEYIYLFTNNQQAGAFQADYISNYRFELDLDQMQKACSLFVGVHDFKNFYCTGSDVKSTVREIFECDIKLHQVDIHGVFPSHYVFRIQGSGFLKQMVRLIMGTIWEVGKGKISIKQLQEELKNPGDKKLGNTAPPNGLFKTQVWY